MDTMVMIMYTPHRVICRGGYTRWFSEASSSTAITTYDTTDDWNNDAENDYHNHHSDDYLDNVAQTTNDSCGRKLLQFS